MKRKALLALSLALLLIALLTISVSAKEIIEEWNVSKTTSDNVTATLYDDYSLVISGSGNMKNWSSSSNAPWYSSYRTEIKTITIGEDITSLGAYAFYYCKNLETVYFNATSMSNLAKNAIPFSGCSKGFTVIVGKNVKRIPNCIFSIYGTSYPDISVNQLLFEEGSVCTEIGDSAFWYSYKGATLFIPNTIKVIGDMAFYEGATVTYVEAGADTTNWASRWNDINTYGSEMGKVVWNHTHSVSKYGDVKENTHTLYCVCGILLETEAHIYLTVSVTAPTCEEQGYTTHTCICGDYYTDNYIDALGHNFVDFECSCGATDYFKKWNISATSSDNVIAYYRANENNDGMYTLIIRGKGNMVNWVNLYDIPWYSSYGSAISSVIIEDGVKNIGASTFSGCSKISSVIIPESVTTISKYAFNKCSTLTSIIIPSSVKTISDNAFSGCSALTIYCEAASKPSGWSSIWNPSNRPVVWDYKNTMQGNIVIFKGYSFNEAGSMAVGFDIDYEAKALYEELTGETLEIGVVFAAYDLLLGNQPLDNEGNAITLDDGAVVKFDLTEYDYTYYDFVITDIVDSIKDIDLVISAYINNGYENKYVQENGIADTVTGISYNEAKA